MSSPRLNALAWTSSRLRMFACPRKWVRRIPPHLARRDHGVTLSYRFVKLALQDAGLVRKGRRRGRHRRRREPRRAVLARTPGEQHALVTHGAVAHGRSMTFLRHRPPTR